MDGYVNDLFSGGGIAKMAVFVSEDDLEAPQG